MPRFLILLACCLTPLAVADDAAPTSAPPAEASPAGLAQPLSPDEARESFVLHPDCNISLVAAEPDVIDPVHIAFDTRGRLWVVEYSDYPNGPADGEPGRSRIRVLTDDNNNGTYEKPVTFAEGLTFATGLLHWRDGVIVTTGTAVLFMRDTDGDGKADETQELFNGFVAENPQLRANHPTLGLDNRIYIASGLRGGQVGPGKDWAKVWGTPPAAAEGEAAEKIEPPAPVSLAGRDFRFDPLTGSFEAVSGPGQFGLTFDDWGNRFVCDNRHPCKQIILEDHYLKRNPSLAVAQTFEDVSPQGEQSRLYPLSRAWTTSNLHAHQFTAACGLCIYRSDNLGEQFHGNAFVCDPTANLVHRDVLIPNGVTFTSHPGREGIEFLATKDEWFRPVNLTIGPDGALYVVDMYRAVIEHPQFMPDELKTRPDLLLGTDKGRIWKITQHRKVAAARLAKLELAHPAIHGKSKPALPDFEFAVDWCPLLESTSSWHRDAAHRLLLETEEPVAEELTRLVRNSLSPQARIHAMWILFGRGEIDESLLQEAMLDADPRVLRQTIRIAAQMRTHDFAIGSRTGQLGKQSPDMGLRFEAALALPEIDSTRPATDLIGILNRSPYDQWLSLAVASAPPETVLETLLLRPKRVIHPSHLETTSSDAFLKLYEVVGATAPDMELSDVLSRSPGTAEFIALTEGIQRRRKRLVELKPVVSPVAQEIITKWLNEQHQLASLASLGDDRTTHITLLYHDDWANAGDTLTKIIEHERNPNLRTAAIDVVAMFRAEDIGDLLVKNFSGEPPTVRAAIVRAMMVSAARINLLLDEIEAEHIAPTLIDAGTVKRLKSSGDATIKERSVKLFASLTPEARQQVLADYQSCLKLESDPLRGQAVFKKNCIACHRIGKLGVDVAPDISDSRTKTAEYLLTHILDPNRVIDNNYFSYTVIDTQGRTLTGVISTETATSITLKQAEGKTTTILRSDIETLHAGGVSLMPEGLEKAIDKQQMADVISFIKNWRYLDGSVPKEVIK